MEQKIKRVPAMAVAAVLSVAAFFLRRQQLVTAFDEGGLPISRGGLLTWFTVFAVVVFAAYAFLLRRRSTYKACNGRGMTEFALSCLAGGCLTVAAVISLMDGVAGYGLLRMLGVLLMAVCWVITAQQRVQDKRAFAWLFLLPTICFAAELVVDFRRWGSDPSVLDYCYELLALISTMCGLLNMTAFCFDKGRRRATVFFCLCAVFFTAASVADVSGAEVWIKIGTILWIEAALWQLLRPGRKRGA